MKASKLDTIKGFHAVEEARKWKQYVWEKTKNMSREELVDYFNSSIKNITEKKEHSVAR